MDLISDVENSRKEIEECINHNGFAPEHNYGYYQWLEESGRENIFLKFPNKSGILGQYNEKLNAWNFISMPIAKEEDRLMMIVKSLDYLFEKKRAKKVSLELTLEFKKKLGLALKDFKLRVGGNNYIYHWPVFDMKKWDGHELKGKKWKKIRNIKNRFHRENKVVVKDARDIQDEKLRQIVNDWIRKRNGIDRPLFLRYFNMIKYKFDGVDFARTLVVNNEPCSITAGWRIPNSNDYYSGIGIYNYKFKEIGEIANLDDLIFLKKKKFGKVDFGGSSKNLLQFKKKFFPSFIYKTYSFPVLGKYEH